MDILYQRPLCTKTSSDKTLLIGTSPKNNFSNPTQTTDQFPWSKRHLPNNVELLTRWVDIQDVKISDKRKK